NGGWLGRRAFAGCCFCLFARHSPFAGATMANVTLRNVRKTYAGGFEAIKGIDFEVADGLFCVLVGPSGCGKSTLLRMVAGLETVTSGEIDIGGRIGNGIEPADRDIGMVVQNYAPYPHLSAYNNRAYG